MSYNFLGEKPFSTQYITGNKYYTLPDVKISNIILHSVGVGSPRTSQQWRDSWNQSTRNSVSAVVGPTEGIIMLPTFEKKGTVRKCAGCGKGKNGSFNNSAAQVEMQEHKSIKYTGGANFTCSDIPAATQYQLDTLDTAIQWMANVCIFHNLQPDKPGVILSHKEASLTPYYKASNHGDVEHLFNQLPGMNMSMDKVRKLVAERVEQYKLQQEVENMTQAEFDKFLSGASPTVIDNIMSAYFARQNKLPASKGWGEEAIGWAVSNGIMAGMGGDNMAPQGLVTREQCMAFLKRLDEKG